MDNADVSELVGKAQLGDKRCLDRLAEVARPHLREYVRRLTVQEDLTEEIVQETILEMLKVFNKLKKADRFWDWLDGIAFNKVRSHYGKQWRHKTVSLSDVGYEVAGREGSDALAEMVTAELKEIVLKSMRQIQPRYRAVLTMRCYKGMRYSEIAKLMKCSEFGAQALFYRAKKALAKELSGYGLGKGTLVPALLLFGKMTATNETAAASISVTAATTKVGLTAGLIGALSSKAVIVSLTAAGALTVGTVVATSLPDMTGVASGGKPTANSYIGPPAQQESRSSTQHWYYYPPNGNGAVMIRYKPDARGEWSYCQWLQNDQANYYQCKNTIYIKGCRMWASDLRVWRLPTDSPQLTDFLSKVEGKAGVLEHVPSSRGGSLVIVRQDEAGDGSQVAHHYDTSDEEYFRYSWPTGAKIIDNRDEMHKRGWTYLRITGQINGEQVRGTGRMPFVYATSKRCYPWLRLKVADKVIVDRGDGRLFKGLARPWMGLHTIDTVRRDAAEQQVWFETRYEPTEQKAEVELTCEQGKMVYTIDMEKDVIDKITFLMTDGAKGELRFSYLQDIGDVGDEFVAPGTKRSYWSKRQAHPGMRWFMQLAEGTFPK
jgi:RNA polymerase sigma-70 factor (ECF subfamily)